MKRFKNILVVLGHEETTPLALHKAAELAKENQATLSILEVIDGMHSRENPFGPYQKLRDVVIKRHLDKLEKMVQPYEEEGLHVLMTVLVGSACMEITKQVVKNRHDLVVIVVEDRESQHHALRLMRICPCPVWSMKSANEGSYQSIMACVDPDPDHAQGDELNHKILELATSQAELEKAKLFVVHAQDFFIDSLMMGSAELQAYEIQQHLETVEKMKRDKLKTLLDEYDLSHLEHEVIIEKGRPREIIRKNAEKNKIDLIVMGTICRSGVAGFFIGNTAEYILRHVDSSVLALKPEGFETPVQLNEAEAVCSVSEEISPDLDLKFV